jgi:hypothetical protein
MIKYRTFLGVICLGGMALAGFILSLHVDEPLSGVAIACYSSLTLCLIGLGGLLAGKSTVEKLAGGGGIKGAIRSLLTDEKPNTPETPSK